MVRPKRFRRIFMKPQIMIFSPESLDNSKLGHPIKIKLDEFEAVRLRDYKNINQQKSAEIMNVSQPTFHRILNTAREKIAKALIEGKIIKIEGGDYVIDKNRYKCKKCGFEWHSPGKEYNKCPDCESEDISMVSIDEEIPNPTVQQGLGQRRGQGRGGMGAGPPRVCKCTNCGYESEKTPGVPCRNTKCPKCDALMCGANL